MDFSGSLCRRCWTDEGDNEVGVREEDGECWFCLLFCEVFSDPDFWRSRIRIRRKHRWRFFFVSVHACHDFDDDGRFAPWSSVRGRAYRPLSLCRRGTVGDFETVFHLPVVNRWSVVLLMSWLSGNRTKHCVVTSQRVTG